MTPVALGPIICSGARIKAFKNTVNSVVALIASRSDRSIDRNPFFCGLKLLTFKLTTVIENNNDKAKEAFLSFVLLPNSMSQLIYNRCKLTCKLIIKTAAA